MQTFKKGYRLVHYKVCSENNSIEDSTIRDVHQNQLQGKVIVGMW